MPNQLAHETSPYLLQHKDNPVDWRPWGDEAFAAARERDVPLLISIGYSACHWCHVMERESFENAEIAALMNEHFVCVKVDREERPDVDAIYMEAVQAMTGQRRLAAERVHHSRRRAVLRRHLLPARAAPRDAELAAGARRGRDRLARPARGDPRAVVADRRAAGGRGAAPGARRRARPRVAGRRRRRPRARTTTRSAAASTGALRSSRPPRSSSSCCAAPRRAHRRPGAIGSASAAGARDGAAHAARDGPRRHLRPGRRRLRALLGRRAPGSSRTSRRCSTTTRCSPARTCTASRCRATGCSSACAPRRSTGRCARCASPRAASPRRSTPTARASRASTTSGRLAEVREALGDELGGGGDRSLRHERGRQLRGRATSPCARRPTRRSSPRSSGACTPRASGASAPASTTSASPRGTRS